MFGFDDDSMASYYAEQGFDAMLMGEDDAEDYPEIQCRYCKRNGFYWEQQSTGKWRLVTKHGKVHVCRAHKRQP